jgi:hypothetical protein
LIVVLPIDGMRIRHWALITRLRSRWHIFLVEVDFRLLLLWGIGSPWRPNLLLLRCLYQWFGRFNILHFFILCCFLRRNLWTIRKFALYFFIYHAAFCFQWRYHILTFYCGY